MTTAETLRARQSATAEPVLRIALLGGFHVLLNEREVPPAAWRLRKASELVKLLALTPGHRLHREQAMELLWPDKPPDSAANNFHQALHVARGALRLVDGGSGTVLGLRGGVLSLEPPDAIWVDVEAFEEAVRAAAAGGDRAPHERARVLYEGELLPEDRYLDWLAERRDKLIQDYIGLLAQLARIQEDARERDGAIDTLRELLDLDPTDETAHRSLMRLYALGDRRRLALRQFERLRATLSRELDVEPSGDSERLYHDILAGRFEPAVDGEPAAQLRPPLVPVPGAASAAGGTPPPRHRHPTRRPNNLPVQLSSFLGRERELREIERLLQSTRLLTLTGTGGAGKTRLAIEAGSAQLGHQPDGIWLVGLGAIRQPALVVQSVAEVFDVREQPETQLVDLVARNIGEKHLVILLDNCEHVVEAAADMAAALLTACPNLRIVATSRQPLRIPGEVVFRVPSLPIPDPQADDPNELASVDSVRLFVERAQAISPSFALTAENAAAVARVCYHLDGLPLAIELAASRASSLPVAAIADRLDDRFHLLVGGSRTALSRQQTLRATLDWSYDLLTPAGQRVLRTLSVFVGGAPLDALETICAGQGLNRPDVLGLLAELVDQSLVTLDERSEQPRYRLLETVREYGRDRLAEAGERGPTETAHASWALSLARLAEERLPGPDWSAAFGRLEVEHDNLRAALERALAAEPELALAIGASTWQFWLWQGFLAEGRRWLDRALDRAPEPTETRARALLGVAALSIRSGDPGAGLRRAEEAAIIYRDHLGDDRGRCRALQFMGGAPWSFDDLAQSESLYRASLDVAREAGFEAGRAAALDGLAVVLWYQGQRAEAESMLDESLSILRALGDSSDLVPAILELGEFVVPEPLTGTYRLVFQETFSPFLDLPSRTAAGHVLTSLAVIHRVMGENEAARRDMEEALGLFRSIGDERAIAYALGRLGNLATATGDFARARDLLEECLAIRHRIRDSRGIGLAQGNLGNLATAEGDFARAQALLDESARGFERRGDRWGYGAALGNLANLALARRDVGEARRLLEESLAAVHSTGRPQWIAWTLIQLAAVMRLAGEPQTAAGLATEALAIFRRLGDTQGEAEALALGAVSVPVGEGKERRPD